MLDYVGTHCITEIGPHNVLLNNTKLFSHLSPLRVSGDPDVIPVTTFVRTTGTNFSVPCPEIRDADGLGIHSLEWFCRGCNGQSQNAFGNSKIEHLETKVVSFNADGTVILIAPERIFMSSTNFSLNFSPLQTLDTGEYFCLVNDQRQPSLISRVIVQGNFQIKFKAIQKRSFKKRFPSLLLPLWERRKDQILFWNQERQIQLC